MPFLDELNGCIKTNFKTLIKISSICDHGVKIL